MAGKQLTERQLAFVKFYVEFRNVTDAALEAGFASKSKNPRKVAGVLGSRELGKVEVRQAVDIEIERQRAEFEERAKMRGVSKERWLQELEIVAFANMDDYATIIRRSHNTGRSDEFSADHLRMVPTDSRPSHIGKAIKKISESTKGIAIELHGKQAALETLGQHYGWIKTGIDLNLPNNVVVNLTMPSNGREVENLPGPVLKQQRRNKKK